MFARSLAGHDKENLYIIVRREEQFAWVAGRKDPDAGETKKEKVEAPSGVL